MLVNVCHQTQSLLANPRRDDSSTSCPLDKNSSTIPVRTLNMPKINKLRDIILLISGDFFTVKCKMITDTIVKMTTIIKRNFKLAIEGCPPNLYCPKLSTYI